MTRTKLKAPKKVTVGFTADAAIVEKINRKYNTFDKRKVVQQRLREFYATLLQK